MINKKSMEEKIQHYAEAQAQTLVERKHTEDGCSYDVQRTATDEEKEVIAGILFSGIFEITLCNNDDQTVKDTCEMVAMQLLPRSINCYDTIYNRIGDMKGGL